MTLQGGQPVYQRIQLQPNNLPKEVREAYENFASIFTMLEPMAFQMLAAENIEFFIERIAQNLSFKNIAGSFIQVQQTSSKFGHVLVKFLMKKLPDLASASDKSSLYLQMFRLVFSAVSNVGQQQATTDNENMLKVKDRLGGSETVYGSIGSSETV